MSEILHATQDWTNNELNLKLYGTTDVYTLTEDDMYISKSAFIAQKVSKIAHDVVIIPEGITSIYPIAFNYNEETGEYEFPEGMHDINIYANKIIFPSTLQSLVGTNGDGNPNYETEIGLHGNIVLNEGLEHISLNRSYPGSCIDFGNIKAPSTLKSINAHGYRNTIIFNDNITKVSLDLYGFDANLYVYNVNFDFSGVITEDIDDYFSGTIYGYAGSTAEEFAKKYGINFVNIGSDYSKQIEDKVDKEEGKGLSTEDYTTEEKEKLAGFTNVVQDEEYVHTDNNYTDAEKEKLENTVGEKSEGENSVIFGSTTNKFGSFELPEKLYYKPIAEEYYETIYKRKGTTVILSNYYDSSVTDYCSPSFYSLCGTKEKPISSEKIKVGDIYYLNYYHESNVYNYWGAVKILSADNTGYGTLKIEWLTGGPKDGAPFIVDFTGWALYEAEIIIRYKFENFTFTENDGTLLDKLYTYTDLWGNKCYTVYKDYTPDIADGSTNDANGNPRTSKVYELTEDKSLEDEENGILHDSEFMLRGLRYEALFNKGTYFAVADGKNTFSSGEDNVASGDDTFSVGYRNIVLADGSTAVGRRILVRGVGANGFGLNGKATGRYAIAFGEGGQALGYASLVFGDHCKALDYYDVAGGFQSVAKGNTSFAFGRDVIASGFGAVALGQLTIADGNYCIVGGNKNECFGDYSFVTGLTNIVNGEYCIVGGNRNEVDGTASIVGGMKNTNTGRWGLMSGSENTLGGQNSAVIGAGNINNGINGAFVAGQKNKNEGQRSFIGGIGNYIAAAANDSLAFGSGINIHQKNNVAVGTTIESEYTQCWSIGRRLKTAADRQMILGIGNEEDSNAMLIIGAGSNNDFDTNAIRLNALTVRQTTGYVEIPKLVLVSPNKNKFMLKVSEDGTLSAERVY